MGNAHGVLDLGFYVLGEILWFVINYSIALVVTVDLGFWDLLLFNFVTKIGFCGTFSLNLWYL